MINDSFKYTRRVCMVHGLIAIYAAYTQYVYIHFIAVSGLSLS